MIRSGIRQAFRLAIWRRSLRDREVDEEIRLHLELRIASLVASGHSEGQARVIAERRFGDMNTARADLKRAALTKESQMRWTDWFESISYDLMYGLRQLRRERSFGIAVVVTLALGIGANATMFGILDHLFLRPPVAITHPEQLGVAALHATIRQGEIVQDPLSYPIYEDLRDTPDAFSGVAAYSATPLVFGTGPNARQIRGMRVTASYFPTLGVRALFGRAFAPGESDAAPGPQIVMLGYGFWQRQFGGSPSAIGATVDLAGERYTIIGVAPAGFTGVEPSEIDAWVPITAGVNAEDFKGWKEQRQSYWITVVARPRSGLSLEQAAAKATVMNRANSVRDGDAPADMNRERRMIVLSSTLPRDANANSSEAKVALLLGTMSLLVLLLACANVANLQLARAIRRRREIAVRVALGVSPGRLARQLTLESMQLTIVGGAVALLVAWWGGVFVRRVLFSRVDWVDPPIDGRVLLYTAIATLVTGFVTGLVPALMSRHGNLATALRSGLRDTEGGRSTGRFGLLVTQSALTVIFLVGTGLFVLSLRRIQAVPLGMQADHILIAQLNTAGRNDAPEARAAAYQRLADAAGRIPGVEGVALGQNIPFRSASGIGVTVPGLDSVPYTKAGGPYYNAVGADFFRTMGTRIMRGRGFTPGDRAGSARVVVVNETLAHMWWPRQEAIGKCMRIGGDTMPCVEVVGISENTRRFSIVEDSAVQFVVPLEQGPDGVTPHVLFLRTTASASERAESVRRQLQVAVPGIPYVGVRSLADIVSPQMSSWRLGAAMFGAFGLVALVLATVGLYGVLAYEVARRTRELGVRVALGARRSQVAGLVIGQGVWTVGIGAVIGTVVAVALGGVVGPLLFNTSPREPMVFGAVALVLAVVAVVATWLPARRAMRVDPILSLRAE
ncbi:MAG: ABC transporter permease [Gemmatimonadaceae bacterium]